jgi:hypothetical protein
MLWIYLLLPAAPWPWDLLKKKWDYNQTVHQLFIDFMKVFDSVRKEVVYSILIEFGVPMKLVWLIKIC